ncbi:MAG: alpha/beta fold hydrolase [Fimbriimonadales bacterium]|nr:alpha/beta fold hydrolase [Fimbriimonadales bacterium]
MRRWIGGLGVCVLLMACRPTPLQSEPREWVPDLRVVTRSKEYDTVRYMRDGVPLYAEIYRPTNRRTPAPAVVLLPGGFVGVNASHREAARRLAKAGYLVALPHMRGQGKSGGFIDFGLEDAVDARGLAKALPQVGGDGRYAYVGISLGGAIAFNAARNDPEVRGVVCVLSPTDFREQRQLLINYGRAERVERWDLWKGGSPEECPECWDARDPLRHVREVNAPILFIQAGEDVLIPVGQACRWRAVRQEMGRTVHTVALTDDGKPWRGQLKERQKCALPFTGWGDLREDHLVFFPSMPHRTNEAMWEVTLKALNRWFEGAARAR